MLPLYQNIRKRRLELNMSQQELADKLGYKSRSAINKIELGINDITQSKIVAFAKALNTTPGELMGEVEGEARTSVSDDDIKFALFKGEVDEITDEMYEEVKAFAQFVKDKHKKKD